MNILSYLKLTVTNDKMEIQNNSSNWNFKPSPKQSQIILAYYYTRCLARINVYHIPRFDTLSVG